MKNRKTFFFKIAAICSTALLMTSFVAYRAGAFNGTGKVQEGPGDTIYKRDTLMMAEYIVLTDSGWYEPVFIYSSKSMRMNDDPRLFKVTRDTVMYGTPRADSIVNAKMNLNRDPVFMGGSKSGPMFSPDEVEPIYIAPEKKSGKKNKKPVNKK
jgi:hypothetical protein